MRDLLKLGLSHFCLPHMGVLPLLNQFELESQSPNQAHLLCVSESSSSCELMRHIHLLGEARLLTTGSLLPRRLFLNG